MNRDRSPPRVLVEHAVVTINFNEERKAKMESQPTSAINEEIEYQEYEVLPTGMYRAKLYDIQNLATQFGDSLKFCWKVIGGDEDGKEISGLANKKLLPKSKLANWARAHLNTTTFPPEYVLKLSTLLNTEVFLTLGVEPRTDGAGERNVIRAVDPVRPKAAKAPPAQPASTDFNDILSGQGVPKSEEDDVPPKNRRRGKD